MRRGEGVPGDSAAEYFLSVAFPDNQVHILDYNLTMGDLLRLVAVKGDAHLNRQ